MISIKKISGCRAFTLIELMIVVAIVGILVSIAAPAFSEYQKKAKFAEAYINIDALKKAQIMFHIDSNFFIQNLWFRGTIGSIPEGNSKHPISISHAGLTLDKNTTHGSFVHAHINSFNKVIPDNSPSYFHYHIQAAKNIGGNYSGYSFVTVHDQPRLEWSSSGNASFDLGTQRTGCGQIISPDGLGASNEEGEDISLIQGIMKNGSNKCLSVFQVLRSHKGKYSNSPILNASFPFEESDDESDR